MFKHIQFPLYILQINISVVWIDGKERSMENISYRDQILWGTSLSMAEEKEIDLCYDFVKEFVRNRNEIYNICDLAQYTKNFIGMKWQCGESVNGSHLCDKDKSIKKENLIKAIEMMVSDDISINGDQILKSFKKRNYVDEYNCGRIFFVR